MNDVQIIARGGKSSYKKDYTISIIRVLSMVSIVLCHFFQYYDIEIAWQFKESNQKTVSIIINLLHV